MTKSPADVVQDYLETLPGTHRRLATTEWGFTADSAGWPLDVGVAIRDGLLRIQAPVIGDSQIDERTLLWWNRRLPLVRFASTLDGEVWLCCDLPLSSITPRELDRVLGLFVLTATQARNHAADRTA
jgi:Putative bacterial sensory transduction regulator